MINPFVANGQLIVREGLKQPVLRWRNIELVGIADDGNGTPDPMQESSADALLLDTSMQGRGLLDILRRVRSAEAPSSGFE